MLDAFARNVARDGRVVAGLARDFVYLVNVDDALLGARDIEVGGLDQMQQDVLDVLANVAGFSQRRRIGDRERDVEEFRQRLGQQRLAAAGRADQHDVAFLNFDLRGLALGTDALVVIVDGHGEYFFGLILTHNELVQLLEKLFGREACFGADLGRRFAWLFVEDLFAQIHALVTDIDLFRPGNQATDLILASSTERAALDAGPC